MGEARDMVKAFAMLLCVFYIFNLEYPKKLEATFLLIQKLFLRISDKCKVPSKVLKLMSDLKEKKERTCLKVLLYITNNVLYRRC